MTKQYLIENYGYNEPIFLNELKIEGMSDNAVRQSVKRLAMSGFLERYDNEQIRNVDYVLCEKYYEKLK